MTDAVIAPSAISPDDIPASLAEALTEIRRLRARIAELEADAAMQHGTIQQQLMLDDQQTRYAHNVPPNAPPHDE